MKLNYIDGYVSGQHDALTWLSVDGSDDAPLAAFDFRVQMRAALCCLAHNLAIGAALERAWLLGHSRGLFRPLKTDDDEIKAAYERDVWAPGRGKAAP